MSNLEAKKMLTGPDLHKSMEEIHFAASFAWEVEIHPAEQFCDNICLAWRPCKISDN